MHALDLAALENVRTRGNRTTARCPECAKAGRDTKGDHLFIDDAGRFGCVLHPGPNGVEHRKRIFALVGLQTETKATTTKATGKSKANGKTWATVEAAGSALVTKEGGTVAGAWPYQDGSGSDVMASVRVNLADGSKTFRPYKRTANGWSMGDPAGLLPLYRLPELMQDKTSTVYVVEGEKCADVARSLGLTATTSAHGAKSAHKTDWQPLAGRNVVLIPDNDADGKAYAETVCATLAKLNPPASVRVVELPGLMAEGDDIADYVAGRIKDGWPLEVIRREVERLASEAKTIETTEDGAPFTVCMEEIQRQPIRWLWKHRIAIGKLTIIAGDPGGGKSHVCVDIASRITTGKDWPDGGCAPAGDVLIMQAEDDEADTLRPRLEAAGADLRRVHVLKGRRLSGKEHPQAISLHNQDTIDRALARLPDCRLLIVDPVSAYLGQTEANDTAEVRALLAPLQELCNRRNVGLVIVAHPNKSAGQKAMYRIGGALGFVAAARVAWLVAKDEDQPERRTFTCIKSNVGPTDNGLAFSLEPWPEEPDYWRVVWQAGVVSLSADDVMNPPDDDREVVRDLDRLLMQELAGGPVEAERITLTLRQAGYPDRTVKKAKKRLGIVSEKAKGGLVGKWVWKLPSTEDGPRDLYCTSSASFGTSSKNPQEVRPTSKSAEEVQSTVGVPVQGEIRI